MGLSDVAAKVQDNRQAGEDNRVYIGLNQIDMNSKSVRCRYRGLYCQLLQWVCKYNPSGNFTAEYLSIARTSTPLCMFCCDSYDKSEP